MYTEIIEIYDRYDSRHVLKISIKSNSYNVQSFAKICRWGSESWQVIHSIMYSNMKTKYSSDLNGNEEDFREDAAELLRVASRVLQLGTP